MKEAWIILKMQEENELPIFFDEIRRLIVSNENNEIAIFPSLDEASDYQEKYGISGQCIEIPIF